MTSSFQQEHVDLNGAELPVVSEKVRGQGIPFSRIRRITGYITGDLSTWGSAKLAEERDRTKHA